MTDPVKVVAVSDLHGHLPTIPECDLLAIGGDIIPLALQRNFNDSLEWLHTTFRNWLNKLPEHTQVVATWGNHDFIGEREPERIPTDLRWHLLQDQTIELIIKDYKLKIHGSPWQPEFGNWAFNLPEDELEKKWALIPYELDLLVLHGPPKYILDKVPNGEHVGSTTLLDRILKVKPLVTIFGHIHDSVGSSEINDMRLYNVSLCNEHYNPVHGVTEFEL